MTRTGKTRTRGTTWMTTAQRTTTSDLGTETNTEPYEYMHADTDRVKKVPSFTLLL